VSAIAVSRTRQNGRPSVMSYAAFNVVMMDTIAPELLQNRQQEGEGQDASLPYAAIRISNGVWLP
jgi:hypothetical protein